MSQQEFQFREEENKRSQEKDEVVARPRSRKKAGALPKWEHPSTYEEAVPPYSYRAQDTRGPGQQQKQESRGQASQRPRPDRRGFSPDGDAFETGYRPYQMWARRQASSRAHLQQGPRHVGRLIFLIILAVILLPVLFKIVAFLLAALAIVFFGFLFFALIALGIVALIFFALRRSLGWPRRTSWRW